MAQASEESGIPSGLIYGPAEVVPQCPLFGKGCPKIWRPSVVMVSGLEVLALR